MNFKNTLSIILIALILHSCKSDEETRFESLNGIYRKEGICGFSGWRIQYFAGDKVSETIKRNNESYNSRILELEEYKKLANKLNKEIPHVNEDIELLLKEKDDINSINYLEGNQSYGNVENTLFQLKNFKNKYPNTCSGTFIDFAIKEYEKWLKQFNI